MILFPNAKINLGLHVLRKRTDGYHDLETVFYPVPLYDILEVILRPPKPDPAKQHPMAIDSQLKTATIESKSGRTVTLSSSGLPVDGNPGGNLIMRACDIFEEKFGLPGDLSIHLHKIIPMGAGLGGGSSDAAFMLNALNQLSGGKASEKELLNMAASIGSDCSFFILNQPAFAEGRGELLQPFDVSLKGYRLVIVKPTVHVDTRTAFAGINPQPREIHLSKITGTSVGTWKDKMSNDFESTIFPLHPQVEAIKNLLYEQGAIYAAMTGSGSAVYGLFNGEIPKRDLFSGMFYFTELLSK